jgi:membrane protein DedA with SNARE-associated domain
VPLGHLVPGIRTLISIPAGIFGVNLPRFVALTMLGAGAWTSALGLAGYVMGSRYEQVGRYLGPASSAIMAGILLWYVYRVATFQKSSDRQ